MLAAAIPPIIGIIKDVDIMKKPVVAKSMRCCSARVIEMRFRLHNAELMPNSNMAYYAQSIIITTPCTKIVPNVLPAIDLGMVAVGHT